MAKIKKQYDKLVVYQFRAPLGDGSFTFFTLQKNGTYKSEQGVKYSFEELIKHIK